MSRTHADVPARPHPAEPVSPEAMAAILRAHRAVLLAYLDRHLPTRLRRVVEPGDVLQDVYLDAFRRLAAFTARDDASTRSWLLTIARHRLVNLIAMANAQKRGGGRRDELAGQPGGGDDDLLMLLEELAVYERTPSASALAHEAAAALEQSLSRLPADYGRALRMRYVDGAAYAAIASAMGRTEAAVQMVCGRALKALRDDMGSWSHYL